MLPMPQIILSAVSVSPTLVWCIIGIAVFLLLYMACGYVKAPPNKAYIVSGLRKKEKILIGRAGFRMPLIERIDKLSLDVMQVDVKTSEAVPTNEFINVTVDGVANIKISSNPELLEKAAEALLGMDKKQLIFLVTQVLEGNMREIVGSVGLKEMVQERQVVAEKIKENAVPDMQKLGIEIVNFNIQNFKDGAGTIENMGIDNVEQIRKAAQIAKAEAARDIAIAEANAKEEANKIAVAAHQRIAEQNTSLSIREAELKKDADPDKVLKVLYKYSDLQVTFGVNMVAIAEGKPVQMGLKTMLGHFIRHQKNVITRRTENDLKQAKARAHILQGLMIAVDNLDEVIALIRSSKNPKEAKARLMERFELSDAQAQAILDMRLQRLTNLEIIALRKEYEDILKLIDRLEGILHSEKKLLAVIRKELQEIAEEFADERRTTIEKADESPLEVEEEAAAPEEVIVAFTGAGQLKRMNPALYKKTPLPTRAEDDKEFADFLFMAKTDETLLIFTDHGNCYPLPVASLNEVKPKDRGQLLSGVLAGLEDDEKALWMTCIRMADIGHLPDILFITRQGMVKRTAAADYDVRSKKFAAVNVKDGDRLLTILPAASRDDLLLFTRSGLCIRFSLDSVPVQGRVAAGVRCMQVEDGDEVIWCGQLQDSDQIVLLTDRGYAKRLLSVDFEKQNRNGKGVKSFYFNKNGSNGKQLAGVVRLEKDDHLIRVQQAKSPATLVERDNVRLQGKQDRGTPLVIAVMDDVVTGAELLE